MFKRREILSKEQVDNIKSSKGHYCPLDLNNLISPLLPLRTDAKCVDFKYGISIVSGFAIHDIGEGYNFRLYERVIIAISIHAQMTVGDAHYCCAIRVRIIRDYTRRRKTIIVF